MKLASHFYSYNLDYAVFEIVSLFKHKFNFRKYKMELLI